MHTPYYHDDLMKRFNIECKIIRMRNFKVIIQLAVVIFFVACSDIENDVPDCIKERIDNLQKDDCEDSMEEYEFQGKLVYIFKDEPKGGCADFGSFVYDSDCNELCFLGGIAGFTECEGVVFYENAVFIREVWKR